MNIIAERSPVGEGGLSLHRRLSFAVDPGHGFAQFVPPPRKTRRLLAKTLVFRLQALDPALEVPAETPELVARHGFRANRLDHPT